MDLAAYSIGVAAIVIAVFIATGIQIWQASRSDARLDRFEAKFDSAMKEQRETLRAEMKEQGEILRAEMREGDARLQAQIQEQGARLEAQMQELRAEVRQAGQRVSDAELEQARLNGVNSVLTGQTHTHESAAD